MSVVYIGPGSKDHQLVPYTLVHIWRKLPTPIKINKVEVSRYQALSVAEYIDMSTGEIIQAANLRNDPRVPPQIYVGEIMYRVQAIMNSLRKEVRDFAYFVLQFRNQRRGITPAVDTLVEWYAQLHSKRVSNVLEEAGLLAGTSLLSPLFQRTGKNTFTKDHLGEDFAATAKFIVMRLKVRSTLESKSNKAPIHSFTSPTQDSPSNILKSIYHYSGQLSDSPKTSRNFAPSCQFISSPCKAA